MSIRNYRKFHEESQTAWDAQCSRIKAAAEQCDLVPTKQQVADAIAHVEADEKQPDLLGAMNGR